MASKNYEELAKEAAVKLQEETSKFNVIKNAYEERRDELQDTIRLYLTKSKSDGFGFAPKTGMYKNKPAFLKVTNVVQKKIVWDVEKLKGVLKKKVDKEDIDKVISKDYHINDIEGLIAYLKTCGVNPKTFKSFLDIKESVNKDEIDLLGDLGKLTPEDIKGCYEIKTNIGFIKITEQSGKEDQEN